jgi:hypothetical protein
VKLAVTNTSPLVFLHKIGRLDLLNDLYGDPVVPSAALDEVVARNSEQAEALRKTIEGGKFKVRSAEPDVLARISDDLGAGERGCIALAVEMNADLVIIDEARGRTVARSWNLDVTGCIGVITQAYQRGLVGSVREELDKLLGVGLWVGENLYEEILRECNEE